MQNKDIIISSSTKVGELLDTYPHLEDVLIGIAPPFKKLKNPILRRSVAKVATLKHIASVGGISLQELINKLRTAVGQDVTDEIEVETDYFPEKPVWFDTKKISHSIDERQSKDSNIMAINEVLSEAKKLQQNEMLELITTFLPAPGIDLARAKGFLSWSVREKEDLVRTYFVNNK